MKHRPLPLLLIRVFILLHSSLILSKAAPPPELTILRQHYDKAYAERVTAVHEVAVGTLNAKFTTALDNTAAQAKSAGDLPTVLAIQADKKLLSEKQPLPADDDKTPGALKKLRSIYREQITKLDEQRAALATALLTPYAARLKELEGVLTKADRIDEAAEVLTYREGLKADAPAPAPAVAAAATSSTTAPLTASEPADTKAARTFPPADDRKAAEWVILLGCAFDMNYTVDGKSLKATDNKPETWELPPGEIHITRILLQFQTPPKRPYKNLEPLAGLQHIEQLLLINMSITDADCDVFASLPKLYEIILQQNKVKFTGSRLGLLASLPDFQRLCMNNCNINSKGVAAISTLPHLTHLVADGSEITDKDLPMLAKLIGLKKLIIGHTKTTADGLAQLRPLTQLVTLGWTLTPKKAKAEFQKIAAVFPGITTFEPASKVRCSEEDVWGLAAFPALATVDIKSAMINKDTFAALARIPTLRQINCHYTDFIDEKSFIALKASPSLETFSVDSGPHITGACILHLTQIPTLKKVVFSRCPDLKPEDIAAFQKARPDVTVEK